MATATKTTTPSQGDQTMATTKQVNYIVDLMIRAGHAINQYYFRGSAKSVVHGPAGGRGSVKDWAEGLTRGEASEVIDEIK
jgi:hypothetical protein